jgi:hypothetical protein
VTNINDATNPNVAGISQHQLAITDRYAAHKF